VPGLNTLRFIRKAASGPAVEHANIGFAKKLLAVGILRHINFATTEALLSISD
jgi:hypothetical protein